MVKPISLDLLWTLNICLKMFRQLHWEMVSPEKHLPFIYKPDGNGSPLPIFSIGSGYSVQQGYSFLMNSEPNISN